MEQKKRVGIVEITKQNKNKPSVVSILNLDNVHKYEIEVEENIGHKLISFLTDLGLKDDDFTLGLDLQFETMAETLLYGHDDKMDVYLLLAINEDKKSRIHLIIKTKISQEKIILALEKYFQFF